MVMRVSLAALAFTAVVHGNVVSIDPAHDLLVIHHHAQAGMQMEMTMAVRMADPRALAHLRRGAFVKLRCDERPNPWVCVRR